jgi:glyoxylase-like metal-dependent hydrolase (beta-lactamase superfamily II)
VTPGFADVIPLHLADVTFPPAHPLAGQTGVVYAYAIRHTDGLVLLDTGVGWGNAELDQAYRPARRPLEAALERHKLRLADVALVINSHLHFDHCGGNRLFPGIPIAVQRAEYEAAHRLPHFTVPEWVDFTGARYQQLDGGAELLPGLRVLATPGHTPGHQSVLLDTRDGLVLLTGQAVYSAAEYEHARVHGALPPGATGDQQTAHASARRLVELRPALAYFSHDARRWQP